jgi:hypothetical protein
MTATQAPPKNKIADELLAESVAKFRRDPVRSKYSNVYETMGDVLYAPDGWGKTLRVKCGPCKVVLRPFGILFRDSPFSRNQDWIQADRVF